LPPNDFPVFAVREWASRFYEQHRLERDGAWWRIGWPFAVATVLGAVAALAGRRWAARHDELGLGAAVVLAAAAVGLCVGGAIQWRAVGLRRKAARARPATVDDVPSAARSAVLDSPRLRYRRPDAAGLSAVRDDLAAQAPVGTFAATVLVWALVVDGREEGTLEDWVRGRAS
jgi:hypothetical protein